MDSVQEIAYRILAINFARREDVPPSVLKEVASHVREAMQQARQKALWEASNIPAGLGNYRTRSQTNAFLAGSLARAEEIRNLARQQDKRNGEL